MEKSALFNCNIEIKSIDEKTGAFTGYASVFGNVDSYGDVVMQGAFKRTINSWMASKGKVPVCWQHDIYDPMGYLDNMEEDGHGLKVSGQLIIESDMARQRYALVKNGVVNKMSFGYEAVKQEKFSTDAEAGIKGCRRKLNEVKLYEVTLTNMPANEDAELRDIKSNEELAQFVVKTTDLLLAMGQKLDELAEKIESKTDGDKGTPPPDEGTTPPPAGGDKDESKSGDKVPPTDGDGAELSEADSAALDQMLMQATALAMDVQAFNISQRLNATGGNF